MNDPSPSDGNPYTGKQISWIEKYRPSTPAEVIGNKGTVDQFQRYIQTGEFPNLLITGPPGTGKSTLTLMIARTLHGSQWRSHTLVLDAINNPRVDTIRGRAGYFARIDPGENRPRLLIIEQAEPLAERAQRALRPILEQSIDRVRTIILCNNPSVILENVKSLCVTHRLAPVDANTIADHLWEIADTEDVQIDRDAISLLSEMANGDVRRAINSLQVVALVEDDPIDETRVKEILSTVSRAKVEDMLSHAIDGEYKKAKSQLDCLLSEGASGEEILVKAHSVAHDFDLFDQPNLDLINGIGEARYRLDVGGDALIQISALLANIADADH